MIKKTKRTWLVTIRNERHCIKVHESVQPLPWHVSEQASYLKEPSGHACRDQNYVQCDPSSFLSTVGLDKN